MKRIGDYTGEGVESWFKRQSVVGLAVKAGGIILALTLTFGVIGFVGGWFSEGARIISPANVKAQWQFAYDYDAQLTAIAQQWCGAKAVEQAETNPDYKSQRISQRLAIEQNYSRVAAIYDGRLRDAFRAKLVRPRDVPASAPLIQAQGAC